MLPGVIAGHYRREEAEFDLGLLAERAYAEFVPATVTALDVERRVATLSDGSEFTFDVASLNPGSTLGEGVPGSREHALPVKPFEQLVEPLKRAGHIAITGGGAAGGGLAIERPHLRSGKTVFSVRSIFSQQ